MDDLKLYAGNDDNLEGILSTLKSFSDETQLQLDLDKCVKFTFK